MYSCILAATTTSAAAAAATACTGCAVHSEYSVHDLAFVTAIVLWATELCKKVQQYHAAWLLSTYVNGVQGADDVATAVVAL